MFPMKDYGLMTKRLIYTGRLFEDLDRFQQLEENSNLYLSNEETRNKLSKVLEELYQMESKPIFEDSGKYFLFNIKAPEKLEKVLSDVGLSYNRDDSYSSANIESLVDIKNFMGIESTRVNVFIKSVAKLVDEVIIKLVPTNSILEILIID